MRLPSGYRTKYQKLMGSRAQPFLSSFNQKPVSGFRINPLKVNRPTDLDLTDPIPWTQWGYYGRIPGRTVDHQSGAVYDQEPSAMYVSKVMNPKPGMKVLDLCAAPGSKTTGLASLMHNRGLLVANEIIPKRARVLAQNLERFGVQNALILNEAPHRLAKPFRDYFDRILVDAPCSGEGMFRKNHQAVRYWSPDYPAKCASRQRKIIVQAIKMLKPGGKLVYSTCTFSPEEDEMVIDWVLHHTNLSLVPIRKYPGMVDGVPEWTPDHNSQLKKCLRLFPNLIKGEGHFIAELKRPGNGALPRIKNQRGNVNRNDVDRWRKFARQNLSHFHPQHLIKFGAQLYAFNPQIPILKGLRVVNPGLHLGTLKKHRLVPAYALALALRPDQVTHQLTISIEQWKKYVHGDTLNSDPDLSKGWYQLICQGQPIAFGKVVQGTVKNFFPKGLRFMVR